MKKFFAALLAMILALGVFVGCGLTAESDDNEIIATVNGVNILKSKYNDIYNYYLYMYQNQGYDEATAKETLDGYKEQILDQLVQEEIVRQHAEADGYLNYSDADREAATAKVNEDKQKYVDDLVAQYTAAFEGQDVKGKKDGETDKEYFTRVAEEKYVKELKSNGYTFEELVDEQLLSAALEKYQADKTADVTVAEADVIEKYDSMYSEQLEAITDDKAFVDAYNNGTYSPLVYYREGYSLVQHILVKFDEEYADKLADLYTGIESLKEDKESYEGFVENETDANEKAQYQASLDETIDKLNAQQAEYDALLEKAKASKQAEANEIYNSVKSGDEDGFIKVLVEKTEDPGQNTEDAAKKGYLVGPSDGMVAEFSNGATALNAGEVGKPVATYYGFHIIRCIKKLDSGKVAFETVKADIEASLLDNEKDTQWQEQISAWEKEAKIKKHTNKL